MNIPNQFPGKQNLFLRIRSIDLLRGAVMVLMAIDHVRVYSGVPPGGPSPGIFFSRWVTHFCAPAFVFLAGVSAFLYGKKLANNGKLAGYLITRGLLLVLLELTVIRFFWTFNFSYSEFVLAGVIWMLGWSMVALAALVRLRPSIVGIIGLAIIFFQQVFQYVPGIVPESIRQPFGYAWEFIYPAGLEAFPGVTVLYVLVPWIGVMAAGYGFGSVFLLEAEKRRRICFQIGGAAIVLFLVIGSALIFTQPAGTDDPPFIFRLLNQRKYPASPLFLLMTLGPLVFLLPFAENWKGKLAEIMIIIGKVPFFYYLLHILLIHISALFVNLIREGNMHPEWYTTAPYASVPPEQRWSLGLLYLVFLIDVVLLYFACRWYAKYKAEHNDKKWLKYI
jgi:uncharacterized membrane protein